MALKPIARFHSVQLLGGEPLLHKNLPALMQITKRLRLDSATNIITNGHLLPKMRDEFWEALEYLQISIYPGFDETILELVESKRSIYGFDVGTTRFSHFYSQFKKTPDEGVESFRDCHWKKTCFTIHRGFAFLCSQSCFFPKAIMGLPAETDGLPLAGLTEEKLLAFLNRTEPFEACKICCANLMEPEPWREATSRKAWLEESKATV